MPHHDSTPPSPAEIKRRFWRIFRLLVLLSVVVAAIAVLLVARGQPVMRIHLMIATGLGIGLTVLVGTGLMTLVFISASSGHDDAAGEPHANPEWRDEE